MRSLGVSLPILFTLRKRLADDAVVHALPLEFDGNSAWSVAVRGATSQIRLGEAVVALKPLRLTVRQNPGNFLAIEFGFPEFQIQFVAAEFAARQRRDSRPIGRPFGGQASASSIGESSSCSVVSDCSG